MLYGYAGKLLQIDLSSKRIMEIPLDEQLAAKYIGGVGLAAPILWRETTAKTDALAPENPLIFMSGPYTGAKVPTSGRHAVCAISPLTNTWGEADVGGQWGTELKKAGYDGLIMKGAAEKLLYIWIHNDKIELRDAGHIWGKGVYEADDLLRAETATKAVTALIGPSAERGALISGIFFDGKEARAAGRGGLGTVMAAKNLKAVVVSGDRYKTTIAQPEALQGILKKLLPMIVENTKGFKAHGTAGGLPSVEFSGDLPIKNWRQGSWEEGARALSGENVTENFLVRNTYCGSCIIGCGRLVKNDQASYKVVESSGPEYESIGTLGSLCLVDDLPAVMKANSLCNDLGLDTISAGSVVAFAMECYEQGLITESDVGYPLPWGDGSALVRLIEDIGLCRGFGKILALGSKRAAEIIGGTAAEYAIHSKGLEFPAHDPRAYASLALQYATSSRGACHLHFSYMFERSRIMPEIGVHESLNRFVPEGKGKLVAQAQNAFTIYDCLKICKFSLSGGVTFTNLTAMYNHITGNTSSVEDILLTGERICNLRRLFNVRRGFSRKDDTIPQRILQLRRKTGGAAEHLPQLNLMLSDYYDYRGWNEVGIPTNETLARLGLDEFML